MVNKDWIQLYTNKADCCGCGACYSVCPNGAIAMVADDEGFVYPSIDTDKCVKCRLCLRACPLKDERES